MRGDFADEARRSLTLTGLYFFEHFPEQASCFLCGTNDDLPCILIGVDGTAEGNIEEAQPIHVQCMVDRHHWRINRAMGVMYARMARA